LTEPFQTRDIVLPYGIFLGMLLVTLLIPPPFNLVVQVFAPVPLVLIYLQRGKAVGLTTVVAIFILLMLAVGVEQAIVFIAEYAIMAVILAETIRLKFPFERSILFAAVGSAVLSLLMLLTVVTSKAGSPVDFFEKEILKGFEVYVSALEESGEKEEILSEVRKIGSQQSRFFASLFPSVIIIGSLLAALADYCVIRALWARFYKTDYFDSVELTRWELPDPVVWLFLASVAVLFVAEGGLKMIGANGFVILLVLYLLQGLAVLLHFFKTKGVPRIFWVLLIVLLFAQPLLIGLAIGLGLFDIWLDFRKLRQTVPEITEE